MSNVEVLSVQHWSCCLLLYFFLLHYSLRQLSSMSPSGKLQAIVRKAPAKNGQEEKQFLEVDCIMIDTWGSRDSIQ